MTKHQQPKGIDQNEWQASTSTVHVERLLDSNGVPQVALLRHTSHPYTETVSADAEGLEAALRDVASRYFARAAALVELGAVAQRLVNQASDTGFGWLDIGWGSSGRSDPRLSFWVERHPGAPEGAVDRTLVLLAAHRSRGPGGQRVGGLQSGLRVVLHLDAAVNGSHRVRITGLSASELAQAVLPDSASGGAPLRLTASASKDKSDTANDWLVGLLNGAALDIGGRQGYADTALSVTGYRQIGADSYRLQGQASRGLGEAARVYAWTARYQPPREGVAANVQHWQQVEQVTGVTAQARALGTDPWPLRPTAKAARLDALRTVPVPMPDHLGLPAGHKDVIDDAGGTQFVVLQSRVGNPTASPNQNQTVPDAPLALRSDRLAAVHACQRAREFFGRLQIYGLPPVDIFKQARLPLLLRHRARFNAAPDGHSVNAQVRPTGITPPLTAPYVPADWPQIEVGFGAANLTHRPLEPNDAGALRAQPLGLAADARWAWHEFGHVLLLASTGELEFRFAHSAGDALAAIVADPGAPQGNPADPVDAGQRRLRMLTFPFVRAPRSHGRRASLGWCWCGRRSRRRQARGALLPHLYSDYFEEQLMSSALFTLYDALGGYPGNDPASRRRASHYTVYLVMRATQLLGPATVVPAQSADAFVSALIDADAGTGDWSIDTTPLGEPAGLLKRRGGAAHKVVRWAFENQGLYATADPAEVVEGPGLPPPVDIHIPGLGARETGGYAPVPLDWSEDPDGTAPLWHAAPEALWADGATVRLVVRNRGSQPAWAVQATCWVAPAGVAPLVWTALDLLPPFSADINAQATAPFSFAADGRVGAYLVLAQVSCVADRSNLDTAAGLPCSKGIPPTDPAALTDLVAGDNNLGLSVLRLG